MNRLSAYLPILTCISLLLMFSLSTQAAELLMLEEDGCVYCAKFNREIAPAYPNTAEGKTAPLRRINIKDDWPTDLAGIAPDTITPTFILVENGVEIDRLYGYKGDEFFWFLLSEMLQKLETTNTGDK